MAKKSKTVSTSRQGNLFEIQDESPNSETIEQAITGPQVNQMSMTSSSTSPKEAQQPRCPQCGGPAALSMKESGKYYCQGACSYGDNFYFTI